MGSLCSNPALHDAVGLLQAAKQASGGVQARYKLNAERKWKRDHLRAGEVQDESIRTRFSQIEKAKELIIGAASCALCVRAPCDGVNFHADSHG